MIRLHELISVFRDAKVKEEGRKAWNEQLKKAYADLLGKLNKYESPRSKQIAADTITEWFGPHLDGDMLEDTVNCIYDLCEDAEEKVSDPSSSIHPSSPQRDTADRVADRNGLSLFFAKQNRTIGYGAVVQLTKSDPSLAKRNADVLVQLLQIEEEEENAVIVKILLDHLRIALHDTLEVIILDHCTDSLRHLSLPFLAQHAKPVLDEIVFGDAENEAKLASWLAQIVPIADTTELEMLSQLFMSSQALWLPSLDFATAEDWESAVRSAGQLLDAIALRAASKVDPNLRLPSNPPTAQEKLNELHHAEETFKFLLKLACNQYSDPRELSANFGKFVLGTSTSTNGTNDNGTSDLTSSPLTLFTPSTRLILARAAAAIATSDFKTSASASNVGSSSARSESSHAQKDTAMHDFAQGLVAAINVGSLGHGRRWRCRLWIGRKRGACPKRRARIHSSFRSVWADRRFPFVSCVYRRAIS